MRALALVVMCGCSVAFVTGPPVHPSGSFECTTSDAAPNVDLGITGALTLGGIAGLLAKNTCDPDTMNCLLSDLGPSLAHEFGYAALLTAGVFALSAWHGYSETDACRTALAPTAPTGAPPQAQTVTTSPAARAP